MSVTSTVFVGNLEMAGQIPEIKVKTSSWL